jgi:hypothetical protein
LVSVPLGNFIVTRSAVGSSTLATILNSDNTNAASGAGIRLDVGGASAGDTYILINITGATNWIFGADNSDSDSFKISASATLGSSDCLTIKTSGVASFSNDIVALDSAKGLVLKDTAGTPHYWRVTVDSAGVLSTTDLGTSPP